MHANNLIGRKIALGLTTAMAAAMLTGCATNAAPRAEASASAAARDMARGNHDRAVEHAEAAVQAEPSNPAYRLTLGNAYLDAGRFASAETALSDAVSLGDHSPRAALALALARIAQAKYAPAIEVLSENEGTIARADLGLAFALAGQPERGIHIMSNAIRGGENNVKMRQNLAYSYAMAGRWREARLMAQQDVPAGEVNARLAQWAGFAPSGAYQSRVAALLGVPAGASDGGQPVHLALANTPPVEQLAAEAAAAPVPALTAAATAAQPAPVPSMPVLARTGELPALGAPASAPAPAPRVAGSAIPARPAADFASAFAPAAHAPELNVARIDSSSVVQASPVRQVAAAPAAAPARAAAASSRRAPAPARLAAASADSTHLVQLGSFLSQSGARRAWNIYVARYPELAQRDMVLTEAEVRGRHYWRVSAGGFDRSASRSLCGRVQSAGESCMTWAEGRPLPGAMESGLRLARR